MAEPIARIDRQSPLAAWTDAFAALPSVVQIAEVPFLVQLNIRVDPGSDAATRIGAVLGVALPTVPCTAVRSNGRHVLWLGPDEWLILAEPNDLALEDALRDVLGTDAGGVTDVSAQRTTLTLSGAGALEVLARGCSIDLHRQVAPAGTCVQTLLARTGITIVVVDDSATRFLLLVRSSFADYLARWFVDACAELQH